MVLAVFVNFGHVLYSTLMEKPSTKEKTMAVISYLPFPPLFIIPLMMAKNDSFAEFHGKQGMAIFLTWFILWIFGLVPIVAIAAYIGFVALIVGVIVGAAQAWAGKRWVMPVIGRYADKLKF